MLLSPVVLGAQVTALSPTAIAIPVVPPLVGELESIHVNAVALPVTFILLVHCFLPVRDNCGKLCTFGAGPKQLPAC